MTAIVDGHTCKVHINCNNCTQVGNLRHVLFTNDWRNVFSTIVSNVLSTNKSSPNLSSGCALTPGTFLLLLYTKQRLNRECYWLVTWIKILIRFFFLGSEISIYTVKPIDSVSPTVHRALMADITTSRWIIQWYIGFSVWL